MRLCQISADYEDDVAVVRGTLVALLRLLESPAAFNNVTLRHYLFCILQVLAKRLVLLYFQMWEYQFGLFSTQMGKTGKLKFAYNNMFDRLIKCISIAYNLLNQFYSKKL